MKRFISGWLAFLALLLAVPSFAFELGRHYQELPFPQLVETGDKIEVREFFWYGCPHCYSFEPALQAWLKKKPANVEFIRTPGTAPAWTLHAQAYYALDSLGAVEKTHLPLFRAMHDEKRPLKDESAIAEVVAAQGIDAKKFHEAFNSFGVRMKVERAKKINQDYLISSVPLLVIDGKYVTGASMAGGEETAIKVLDHLIAVAAKERKKKR